MIVLNARLIKPSHFDPARKYPVLIYVYNGPHVQLVSNTFIGGASLWMLEAAERGYLVWTVDGHGSDNRGRDFEQAVHRQLGDRGGEGPDARCGLPEEPPLRGCRPHRGTRLELRRTHDHGHAHPTSGRVQGGCGRWTGHGLDRSTR